MTKGVYLVRAATPAIYVSYEYDGEVKIKTIEFDSFEEREACWDAFKEKYEYSKIKKRMDMRQD